MRVLGQHRDSVLGVTSCGPHLVSASFHEHVVIWKGGQRLARFGVASGVVCWMGAMSSQGVVAAGFGDLTVQLWHKGKQRPLATLDGIVASLAWSADGTRLVTGSCGDNTVRLWDPKSGQELAKGKTKKSGTWFVALSPDGKTALSGASDKLVHVWDIGRGHEVGALTGHTGKITCLCISQNGKRAASASQDRTARIWDLKKGLELAVLGGHRKQVTGVALSSDGKRAATVSGDRLLRLWDASTGEETARFPTDDLPTAVTFHGDEVVVAAGSRLLAV
jgi:WD40 repeat protein